MASREQIKNLLPILQAFAEGKTIEVRHVKEEDGWSAYPRNDDDFILNNREEEKKYKYRIKPEKKSAWVLIYKDGSMSFPFTTKKTAQELRPDLPVREIYWEE